MSQTSPRPNVPPRKSTLPPPDEGPVQMSPFSDERWDIDIEENRRRREIHRNYVLGNFGASQKNKKHLPHPEEPPKKVSTPKDNQMQEDALYQGLNAHNDVAKKEVYKPKTWADLKFDSPKPPDLYPLLKFPQKRVKPEEVYNLLRTNPDPLVISIPGKTISQSPQPSYEIPPIPQFSSGIPKAEHYGTNLPLWEFQTKTENKP